jgi:hypothetical protein
MKLTARIAQIGSSRLQVLNVSFDAKCSVRSGHKHGQAARGPVEDPRPRAQSGLPPNLTSRLHCINAQSYF